MGDPSVPQAFPRTLAGTAVLPLLVLALAGCAADEPASEPVSLDPVAQRFGAERLALANGTGTDPLAPMLLSAQAGPEAPLSSFLWTVPPGAIHEVELFPGFGDIGLIQFDVVPVGAADLALEEYAILVFSVGRTAQLVGGWFSTPMSGFTGDLVTRTPVESPAPEFEPMLVSVSADGLSEGDVLAIVVAARAPQSVPFGLLVAASDPEDQEDPSEDEDELLAGRLAVPRTADATGSGFQYAYFVSIDVFLPPLFIQVYEFRTAAVQVTDRLASPAEPAVVLRDRLVEASFDSAGHSEAVSLALAAPALVGACPEVGTYAVGADLHGTTYAARNLLLGSGPSILATGLPIFVGVGAGEGAATSSLELRKAAACGIDIATLMQWDLGATLDDLTGAPTRTAAMGFPGLVGDLPPLRRDGADLLLAMDGALVRLDGALTGLPPESAVELDRLLADRAD